MLLAQYLLIFRLQDEQRRCRENWCSSRGVKHFLKILFKSWCSSKLPGTLAHLHAVWCSTLGKPEPWDWHTTEQGMIRLQEYNIFFSFPLETVPMFYLSQGNKCEHHTLLIQLCLSSTDFTGAVDQPAQKPAASLLKRPHRSLINTGLPISHNLSPGKPFLETKGPLDYNIIQSPVCL